MPETGKERRCEELIPVSEHEAKVYSPHCKDPTCRKGSGQCDHPKLTWQEVAEREGQAALDRRAEGRAAHIRAENAEADLAKAHKEAEKHCKEVEKEASEMVDDTVDAWVDRLDTFEARFRAEIKSRMQRIGSSSSVIAADVEAALDIANAAVRVTGAGSPSQVLARQWRSRAEKAEAERNQARKEGREEVREALEASVPRIEGVVQSTARRPLIRRHEALRAALLDSLTKEGDSDGDQ